MSFILLLLALLLVSPLAHCQTCQDGHLHQCTCLNVSHTDLTCQQETDTQFVYQSLVSPTEKLRSLQCGPHVDPNVLESMERSQVGRQTVSVKMVGCNQERFCTPVLQPVPFSIEPLLYHFVSFFSFTHTKGKIIKDLDLIGCTHLENGDSLDKIKNITNAEAINIFRFGPNQTEKTLMKFIYFPGAERNSTNQIQILGINVDLSGRSIGKLEKDAFWSEVSYQIKTLNLSHNSIDSLAEGSFPNSTFSTTKFLDLSFNKLSHLQTKIFQNLTSVADLNLAGNRLTVLYDGIFDHNPLERLRLSDNLLTMLETNTLRNALNLESLDLSQNKLKFLSLRSDNNFKRLLTLNVAHNSLTALDESWKVGYPTLRMLNVSHNSIGPVLLQNDLQFVKTYHGMSVDLSFNNIEIVHIDKAVGKNRKRFDLDLKGNPIKCDCSATDLKTAIEGKLPILYFHLISDIICQDGSSLQDMDYKDLNCPLEDPDDLCASHGCSCIVNEHFQKVTIDCSSSSMTEFPESLIQLVDDQYAFNLVLPPSLSIVNTFNLSLFNWLDFSGENI